MIFLKNLHFSIQQNIKEIFAQLIFAISGTILTLGEKCPYSELFCSVLDSMWTKYGPELLRILTFFTPFKLPPRKLLTTKFSDAEVLILMMKVFRSCRYILQVISISLPQKYLHEMKKFLLCSRKFYILY